MLDRDISNNYIIDNTFSKQGDIDDCIDMMFDTNMSSLRNSIDRTTSIDSIGSIGSWESIYIDDTTNVKQNKTVSFDNKQPLIIYNNDINKPMRRERDIYIDTVYSKSPNPIYWLSIMNLTDYQ